MDIELGKVENAECFKTKLNDRLQATCNQLLLEIEHNHARMKKSWGKTFINAEETKKTCRKSDLGKSETCIGNTIEALNLLTGYIDSLETLKKKQIKSFIEFIRNELDILRDSCGYGENQRKTFKSFYSETFTEELLAEHENELRILKQHYNNNKDIFKLVSKREKLWQEKINFENPPDGCSRFENRGGTLIKELKRYQIVEKQLPITENQIRSKVKVWERKNKNIFLIQDSQYIQYIDSQKMEYKEQQEMKRKAKRLAKQEELAQEMSHSINIGKRTSFYDNTLSKTVYKEISEEALRELMKPTESSSLKSRMPLKNCGTPGDGLSKLSKSYLPHKNCATPREELPSKLSKMDISSVRKSPLTQKVANNTIPSRTLCKVNSKEHPRDLAKPTESSLLKSRLPLKNSKSENVFKRKGSLQTDARKRKVKRRSSVRLGDKSNYLKDSILEETSLHENRVHK